jgi:hypothetical protein
LGTACCDYPKPIGKISSLDAFLGETYFEVATSYFGSTGTGAAATESALTASEDEINKIVLEFSVWANEGNGDCDRLGTVTKFSPTVFSTDISHLSKFFVVLIVTSTHTRFV